MPSPYEIVLGHSLADLHPRLTAYFGEIPAGSVGRGSGTFDRVGTPRLWLWPALAVLARAGVAFPAWERDVAFTVENRPVVDSRGHTAVSATRTFSFRRGERRMTDAITAESGAEAAGRAEMHLVDHLGAARRVTTRLRASVIGGELHLHGDRVGLRIGPRHVAILRALSPTVELVERFDDEAGRQHVSVELRLPVVGLIYEYSGHFDYAVVPESPAAAASARDVSTQDDSSDPPGRTA